MSSDFGGHTALVNSDTHRYRAPIFASVTSPMGIGTCADICKLSPMSSVAFLVQIFKLLNFEPLRFRYNLFLNRCVFGTKFEPLRFGTIFLNRCVFGTEFQTNGFEPLRFRYKISNFCTLVQIISTILR
jgi:hypothetical protein